MRTRCNGTNTAVFIPTAHLPVHQPLPQWATVCVAVAVLSRPWAGLEIPQANRQSASSLGSETCLSLGRKNSTCFFYSSFIVSLRQRCLQVYKPALLAPVAPWKEGVQYNTINYCSFSDRTTVSLPRCWICKWFSCVKESGLWNLNRRMYCD